MKRATRPAEIVVFYRMRITKCRAYEWWIFKNWCYTGDNQPPSSLSVVSHSLRNANCLPRLDAIVEWKETVTGAGFEPAPPLETATWTQRLRPLGHPVWLLITECRKHSQQAKEIICIIKILCGDLCCELGSITKDMTGRSKPLFDIGLQSLVLSVSHFFQRALL